MAYVCEKAVGTPRTCDFRSGKIILQQQIERAQMEKLLATGKTDLLNRFISKKGRPFKAFLVKTPGGKIGFEFQARVAKPGAVAKRPANDAGEEIAVAPLKKAAAKTTPARAVSKAKKAPAKRKKKTAK
jgi:DNA topoisomerase-3